MFQPCRRWAGRVAGSEGYPCKRRRPGVSKRIHIGERLVGPGEPCYVVAEAGSNHNRDLNTAYRLIDAAAEAGADAVKFQTYSAERIYARGTPMAAYLEGTEAVRPGEGLFDLIKR